MRYFFFNDTATTEIYTTEDTLSLHDALPICRLPLGAAAGTAPAAGVVALGATPGEAPTQPTAEPLPHGPAQPPAEHEREPHSRGTAVPGNPLGPKRPGHHGLRIQFESRPDDGQLGRLVESTVWVN